MTDGSAGTPAPEPGRAGPPGPPTPPTGWGPAPGPADAPRWGQYAPGQPQDGPPQGGYGQYGQYGNPGPPGGGATGYPGYAPSPPPPRPGIIPLRPLSLGELLDGAFRAIRTNPRVMFGLSAVVVTATALVQLAITWSFFTDLESLLLTASEPTTSDLEAMDAALTDLLSQLAVVLGAQTISAVVTTVLSGLLIVSVSQSVLGRRASLGEVWATARGRLVRLLLLSLLVTLIVLSPLVPWAGLTIAALSQEQWGVAALVGFVGGIVALVAVAYLVTKTVLATPALMLERSGILAALRRGWTLTAGTFWRVLGIYLLTMLLVSVVSGAISGSTSLFFQITASDPTGAVLTPGYLVATTVAQIVATALTTPFTAAVIALLYIDVRMRTEGLDLELARAAERAS